MRDGQTKEHNELKELLFTTLYELVYLTKEHPADNRLALCRESCHSLNKELLALGRLGPDTGVDGWPCIGWPCPPGEVEEFIVLYQFSLECGGAPALEATRLYRSKNRAAAWKPIPAAPEAPLPIWIDVQEGVPGQSEAAINVGVKSSDKKDGDSQKPVVDQVQVCYPDSVRHNCRASMRLLLSASECEFRQAVLGTVGGVAAALDESLSHDGSRGDMDSRRGRFLPGNGSAWLSHAKTTLYLHANTTVQAGEAVAAMATVISGGRCC